ncbi:MAG: C25 family peptidase propeptide domain-containing protein, partial [Candidatus Marinimicrobia bacterium]|nr:C25 family peptidase propeptide domain-containing protein [Candidatus Neomarinimicrobiota bacterium]
MKKLLISIISFTFLTASTWQNIQSSVETQTNLDVQSGNLERNVVEFNIDGFHLISVQTPEGEMYLARLEDGASLLRAGSPDMHKYARSIVIPDDRQMSIKVLSSDFVDYENILIAPSKGNLSRLIDPSDVEYEFG